MARPRKWRRVCCLPENNLFGSLNSSNTDSEITQMTVEEYETIRLIDLEGLTQEECAQRMKVARTTVQRTYNDARKKLALALISGHVLKIAGGNYKLYSENEKIHGCGRCRRKRHRQANLTNPTKIVSKIEGGSSMKIAIPVDGNSMDTRVAQSFGRAPYFLIYDAASKESEFIDNSAIAAQGGAGIKAAQTVVDNKVGAIIVPRCGQNAADVMQKANIKLYKMINDSVQDNIDAFNDDRLSLLDEIHAGYHKHGGK